MFAGVPLVRLAGKGETLRAAARSWYMRWAVPFFICWVRSCSTVRAARSKSLLVARPGRVRDKVREFWAVAREEITGAAIPPPFFWR